MTDEHRSIALKARIAGVAKNVVRRIFPPSLRHKLWDLFARDYFERSSIKTIVARLNASTRVHTIGVQWLIEFLKKDGYRPNVESIKSELGIDFKGYSYQDLIAYLYFNGKSTGFFVDIGAFDGIEISNTYALEQLGWDGICVEPIPETFSLLQKNRKCHKYNAAISSSTSDDAEFLKVSELLGLSGLTQQMPERIKNGLEKQELDIERIKVKLMTFDKVMQNHSDISYIDFLSIDVEGGELDVLKTIDFKRYRFGLITIENNAGTAILRDYMNRHGYVIFLDLGVDLMFVPS